MPHGVFVSRRWAFGIAYGIGFLAVLLLVVVVVQNSRRNDAEARQREEVTAQFCTAIPNVASRTAQALVDVIVADDRARHVPEAKIDHIVQLGRIYTARARTLALSDLPACKSITPQEVP